MKVLGTTFVLLPVLVLLLLAALLLKLVVALADLAADSEAPHAMYTAARMWS